MLVLIIYGLIVLQNVDEYDPERQCLSTNNGNLGSFFSVNRRLFIIRLVKQHTASVLLLMLHGMMSLFSLL